MTLHSRAVLFDLDGTLLDTIDDLADSMNKTLVADGLAPIPVAAQRLMVGEGVAVYVERALPAERIKDPAYVKDFTARFRADYARNWMVKTRSYPGVPELLDALDERGLRMAVLSNKPDEFTRKIAFHFFGEARFAAVRGARDGTPLKPDPASALAIAREMGLSPGAFLYLGDTAVDMETARAAEMYAVGALWGFRPREELVSAGAQALIERPQDLLRLL
jgi:phosphoglycolate phosphatase